MLHIITAILGAVFVALAIRNSLRALEQGNLAPSHVRDLAVAVLLTISVPVIGWETRLITDAQAATGMPTDVASASAVATILTVLTAASLYTIPWLMHRKTRTAN